MLPLTSSVYVNGTLASKDSVLVDIGTGYYMRYVMLACKIQGPCQFGVWYCIAW